MIISISDQPLDLQEMIAHVTTPENGGIVAFLGVVRRHNAGPDGQAREVHWLEYESYREAALEEMRLIAQEIETRWGLKDIAMVHRVGRLAVGEPAVGVAVGAPHRGEAFDACEYAIDTLKARVPIWKKESWEAGAAAGQSWVVNQEVGN